MTKSINWDKKVTKNKAIELQVDFHDKDDNWSWFQCMIELSRKCDHSGLMFRFGIWRFWMCFSLCDIRGIGITIIINGRFMDNDKKINIYKAVDNVRYSGLLDEIINDKFGGGKEILRLKYKSDYQGYVDIDVLLNDGKVFSYYYSYGSCSGCDRWSGEYGSDYESIKRVIIQECTIFDNIYQYKKWRKTCPKDKGR